jgi:hypothetical protein
MKSKSENQSESENQNIVKSSNGETKNSKGQLKVVSLNVCGLFSKSKIPDFVEFCFILWYIVFYRNEIWYIW